MNEQCQSLFHVIVELMKEQLYGCSKDEMFMKMFGAFLLVINYSVVLFTFFFHVQLVSLVVIFNKSG